MKILERCYKRSDDIVSRKIADEVILVPIRNNVGDLESIYTLNEVGARTWELIDGQRTSAQVKDVIVSEFEVDDSQAKIDVEDFIQGLMEIKAIREI